MSYIENTPTTSTHEPVVVGEFPCTQTQLRCWILDQLKPGNPALNVAVRWEIRGAFKPSSIEAAFRMVVQRHEILRTRFIEKEGRPIQQVVDSIDFKMSVIDLRNMPAGQRQERILSIGEETASAPFNFSQPGLFRVSLLIVENDMAFLLITAHQSCFDGWSIRVLGREVGEIAAAIDAGREPVLPNLPLQYGDFALWQEEYLASYGFENEKNFWQEQLGDAPYFEVPTDHPRKAVKTNNGNILSAVKTPEFGERMERAASENRVSLYSYGAAVVSAMLHRFTGANDILFGTQIAGRDHSDLEDMIGVFINNLVLRFRISPEAAFADHIHAASETVIAALNHQRMPFNKLVEYLNPVRDLSRNPLISVNFNLQKAFMEDKHYGEFELLSAPSQSPGVIYDLSFIMVGRPSGWRMSIEYNTDLFDAATIEILLQLWQDAYELALTNPAAHLSELKAPKRRHVPRNKQETPVIELSHFRSPDQSQQEPAKMAPTDRMSVLTGIWTDVLGLKTIEPEGDFFAYGGHSLLALRMLSAVRNRFGVEADLALLFKEPTLKGFARALFGEVKDEADTKKIPTPWESSVYKKGTGPYAVYTLNHPFLYYRLAKELDDAISVYNVNMFNATRSQCGTSLESIASQAIDAMHIEAQDGPIAVVGLCVNGVLAMEVARQLRAAGKNVTFTAIIDSWAPGYFRSLPKVQQRWWNTEKRVKRVRYFAGKLMSGRIGLVTFLKQFNISLNLLRKLGIAEVPTSEDISNARVTQILVDAARDYKPQQAGATILFRSRANHPRAKKLLFGWGDIVGEDARVLDLEGWHEDSLTADGICDLASSVERKFLADRF